MHGSFCALGNAVPYILRCFRSVLRHLGCPVDGSRPNSANGDGDGQNDRKECFHGTKVSLPPARVRLPIVARDARLQRRLFARANRRLRRSPQLQPALVKLLMISQYFTRLAF